MVEDLSAHHRALTRLFPRFEEGENAERYKLSDAQLAAFVEHGFVAPVPMLADTHIDALLAQLEGLMALSDEDCRLFYEYHSNESREPNRTLFHALGAWRVAPGFHDLLWHPSFTIPATQLLEGPVRFWHDQLFCKPPFHGGVVAWHQDYSYWTRTEPMAHLSCFIALDDMTVENGCLHYVPGSHRWELLPITGLAGDMHAIEAVLTASQRREFRPVAIELKRGEASFHHPLMVHGSFENNSARPRRATVINVFRDGVLSASDKPPLEGVPPIPTGEKMQGRFFPLLLDQFSWQRNEST